MKLKVKDLDIATGGPNVILLSKEIAMEMNLHYSDRAFIKKGKKLTSAIVNIAESEKPIKNHEIGLFEEVLDKLNAKENDIVEITIAPKPESVFYIRKKLDGEKLNEQEINQIVKDIVEDKLSEVEMTYFVSGCYAKGLSTKETIALTKSIVANGGTLKIKKKPVFDFHCTGGVAGNRTTLIVLPILLAAGLIVPKTSSRAITSPSGTADTFEVLTNVTLSTEKMQKVVDEIGGCLVWGGSMNLAAADDKLIKIRHPLSLDPIGMLLASILAKKTATSATHVLIDIPIGKGIKTSSITKVRSLSRAFRKLGTALGLKIKVIVTDGNNPVGNGIGPVLEARDVLYTLTNDLHTPIDLKERSIHMAAEILEMINYKNPKKAVREILESGKAYEYFKKIVKAQGGNPNISPYQLKLAKFSKKFIADRDGIIKSIDNKTVARIALMSGAPLDKEAGIYINAHVGQIVKKRDPLFTIYANSKEKLDFAYDLAKTCSGFTF